MNPMRARDDRPIRTSSASHFSTTNTFVVCTALQLWLCQTSRYKSRSSQIKAVWTRVDMSADTKNTSTYRQVWTGSCKKEPKQMKSICGAQYVPVFLRWSTNRPLWTALKVFLHITRLVARRVSDLVTSTAVLMFLPLCVCLTPVCLSTGWLKKLTTNSGDFFWSGGMCD